MTMKYVSPSRSRSNTLTMFGCDSDCAWWNSRSSCGQLFRPVLIVELQHLHRDVARGVREMRAMPIERLVDGAAAAAAEDRQQLVAIAQDVRSGAATSRRRVPSARRLCALHAGASSRILRVGGRVARIEVAAEQRRIANGGLDVRGRVAADPVLGDQLAPARAGRVERRLGRIARRRAGLIGDCRTPVARCRSSACAPVRRRSGRGADTGRAAPAHPTARPGCCGRRTERTPACPHGRSGRRCSHRASWRARGARRRRQQVPCLSTHS